MKYRRITFALLCLTAVLMVSWIKYTAQNGNTHKPAVAPAHVALNRQPALRPLSDLEVVSPRTLEDLLAPEVPRTTAICLTRVTNAANGGFPVYRGHFVQVLPPVIVGASPPVRAAGTIYSAYQRVSFQPFLERLVGQTWVTTVLGHTYFNVTQWPNPVGTGPYPYPNAWYDRDSGKEIFTGDHGLVEWRLSDPGRYRVSATITWYADPGAGLASYMDIRPFETHLWTLDHQVEQTAGGGADSPSDHQLHCEGGGNWQFN